MVIHTKKKWTLNIAIGVCLKLTIFCLRPNGAQARDERYTLSAQIGAFAPNAGGQQAYTLKLATAKWEAGIFSNQYLQAGNLPLSGATLDWRFPICGIECFWQFHAQTGVGLSNGGPLAQITWSAIVPPLPIWLPRQAPRYFPAIRLDFTTQFIFIKKRAITWSYPLWAGISIPF